MGARFPAPLRLLAFAPTDRLNASGTPFRLPPPCPPLWGSQLLKILKMRQATQKKLVKTPSKLWQAGPPKLQPASVALSSPSFRLGRGGAGGGASNAVRLAVAAVERLASEEDDELRELVRLVALRKSREAERI